ncbi:thyrotropin receptor-like [Lampris incognitus]|uniref:thyrotropin receptor-like n=1 Tax=Lampris incognitus TaxID=2546036 RepID=UPI0024B62713|nr:thyrotropin receptor-like [Lampris incognitus]XP_056158136.1 thyrotropin receptor-like [Lampris incognitus]
MGFVSSQRHGIPNTVVSDNRPCFNSKEWQKFAEQYDFRHVTSSPLYAQSNGKAEKGTHILKQLLKKAADSQVFSLDWKIALGVSYPKLESSGEPPIGDLLDPRGVSSGGAPGEIDEPDELGRSSLTRAGLTRQGPLVGMVVVFITSVESTLLLEWCPAQCECESETRGISCFDIDVIPSFHPSTEEVWLVETRLLSIPQDAFANLVNVSHIYISDDEGLRHLDKHSFHNLPLIVHIEIRSLRTLSQIDPEAFKDLPNLKYLGIFNTGLYSFPVIYNIQSTQEEFLLEIVDNLLIEMIPANSFHGICDNDLTIIMNGNGLKEIQHYAFNGSRLQEVYLNKNVDLERVDEFAFSGVIHGPTLLDLSETRVSSLPSIGLGLIEKLRAKNTWTLKKLPPLTAFLHLQKAELTFHSHCCGLKNLKRWRGHTEAAICNLTRAGVGQQLQKSSGTFYPGYQRHKPFHQDPHLHDSDNLENIEKPYHHQYSICPSEERGLFYVDSPMGDPDEGFDYALCNKLHMDNFKVSCRPLPDAFNPCEDVMSHGFLRVFVWIVSLLAILANSLVMVILLISHHKLSITRFLICHLAFADFCMGLYLLLIGSVDLYTRSQYYHHAIDWQTGAGCNLAGTLSIFASELSVYTLTAITLQRWHDIFFAMRSKQKLRMRHIAAVMLVGWLLCLILALLPLAGVSSYQKVSVCLPMDTKTSAAQVYVVSVLTLNILAFMVVCVCYFHIYCMVHNPEHQSSKQDASMAKRMAVLIFTNLLCLFPVSFYGLSAALHRPLITVTQSKVLLVLFYPLNSCANPFLYTILTRTFHRDVLMLLSRTGIFQPQTQFNRY